MLDRKLLTEAVNYLILAPNSTTLINEISKIVEEWDVHPMAYSGKLEPLNAIVEVGLQSREAFEHLVKLVEAKRQLIPKARRADYQRNLMRQRRARKAKALELAEATQGKMSKADAKAYIDGVQERWNKAKDEFIASKGVLDWKGRNAATNEFWEMIDRQLDQNLHDLRKKISPAGVAAAKRTTPTST